MSKRVEEFEEFSIEEIIAEIKGEAGGKKPPVLAAQKPDMPPPGEEPPAPKKPRAEPQPPRPAAKERPLEDDDVKVAEPSPGKRLRAEPPSSAQLIFDEEARLAEEARRKKQAPWRTEREKPQAAPQMQDTQEFEVTLEIPAPDPETGEIPFLEADEDEKPRRRPYDFLNNLYSDPGSAVKALDKRIAAMGVRILLIILPLLAATYMTVSMPMGLPMPFGFYYKDYPYVYCLVYALLHAVTIIMAADVTAPGLMRIVRLRPTMDSLVLFGQLCIMAHNISIILAPRWGGYLPFTCVGIFTLLLALVAKRQRAESLRRTYKATLLGTAPTAVKRLEENGVSMAVKTEVGAWVDMEELAEYDPTEKLSEIFAPIAMAAVVGLAAAASFGQQAGGRFLWCLAALAAVSAPGAMLLSASMPVRRLSKKLFASGGGLINPKRTRQLAKCQLAVLRDADIFPAGAVEIGGMKIASSQKMETVLACATAVVQEIGGGIARAFAEFSRQQYINPKKARNIRFFESGGISADIDGRYVLVGTASFLLRMGVQVTEGVKIKNSLFIAIDSAFAGIFSVKYGVQSQPYSAFRTLRNGKVTPCIATRDINISQAYVESRFDLRAGSTEYPDLTERIRLSESNAGSGEDTLAFLSRDGMQPFAEAVSAAKKQRRAVRIGQAMGFAAMITGMLIMYFLVYNFKVSAATPHNVLLFLMLWLVPTCLGSLMTTKL